MTSGGLVVLASVIGVLGRRRRGGRSGLAVVEVEVEVEVEREEEGGK